jgi:hypothetical protein
MLLTSNEMAISSILARTITSFWTVQCWPPLKKNESRDGQYITLLYSITALTLEVSSEYETSPLLSAPRKILYVIVHLASHKLCPWSRWQNALLLFLLFLLVSHLKLVIALAKPERVGKCRFG